MSFGRLAGRISDFANKSLFTGLILVGGLAVGHQVVQWWRPTPEAIGRAEPEDGLGDPQRTHEIEFPAIGWRLARGPVTGGREAAVAELRRRCRAVLDDGSQRAAAGQTITPGLGKLLATLKPIEERAGRWRLYEFKEGLPLVLGIESEGREKGGAAAGRDSVAPVAGDVVTWGIAIPAGSETWTAYTLTPSGGRHAGGRVAVPPPSGAQPLLSVEAVDGGAITTFRGRLEEQGWKEFYDRWFGQEGWTKAIAWRQDGPTWRAQFRKQSDGRQLQAHLEFLDDAGRGDSGAVLITATPLPGEGG